MNIMQVTLLWDELGVNKMWSIAVEPGHKNKCKGMLLVFSILDQRDCIKKEQINKIEWVFIFQSSLN